MARQSHDQGFFRREVTDTYRSAARLGVYAAWAGAVGVLLAVSVVGSMLIGWIDASDGFTLLGFALLAGIVAAAGFYSDAARTTVNAANLERQLDVGDDLYAGTDEYRHRLRRVMFAGLAVIALGTVATAAYSVANVDTRTTHDDDDDDDDRDDGDDTDRDDGGNEAPEPDGDDGDQEPATGGQGGDDDDGEKDDD